MGYRKIQGTGRGSYIISLPKEWIQGVGLEKGSEMALKIQEDSSLVLVPGKAMKEREGTQPKPKEFWILVERREDPKSLCRKITSLYVVSADLIHLRFKDEDTQKCKVAISSLVRNTLLGAEIIDEAPNELTLQILVNHPEFPVEKAIRRMTTLALLANKNAILALKNMDQSLIQSVLDTCYDVNRLNPYVIRQLKFGLERGLFKEMGFKTPKEFLGYRIVANDIKSIANNATNIVNDVISLKKLINDQVLFLKEPMDEEVYSQTLDFNSLAHRLFEESLKAMFKRSYEDADAIFPKLEPFSTLENDIVNLIYYKKLDPNVASIIRLALDNSRRVVEYSRDVAEVTLNRTVEEISSQIS